jgi:hypothetical protein
VTLDGVLEQTADLDEREVGRQLVWIEGGRHGPSIACFKFAAVLECWCASNLKQLTERGGRCTPSAQADRAHGAV